MANKPIEQPVRMELKSKLPDVSGMLKPEEQEALLAEASRIAEQEFNEEIKRKFLKAAIANKKRELAGLAPLEIPADEEMVEIEIDIGASAPYILIDGVRFDHGHAYTVSRGKAESMLDMMHRTYVHEAEIHGENMNSFYGRRRQNTRWSMKNPIRPLPTL